MTTYHVNMDEFDRLLINIFMEVSQGPEIINVRLIKDIIDLVEDYEGCLENLLYRLNEFIDSSPPNYLLSSLYIIDALIRYPTDEMCVTIERRMTDKLSEVVTRISNSPQYIKDKACILLDHWRKHRVFGEELLMKCKDTIKNSEFPGDSNIVQIKTNVILLTQLPSDWNEYKIKEAANDVAQILRVSLKPERHFAFIATPTRQDAEKLKAVLEKRVLEVKATLTPKVVWGTEYWMKNYRIEDVEGIVYIPRDRIPPTITINEDGTYISERFPRQSMSRDMSYRTNRFGSSSVRGGSLRERSNSRN